MTDPEKNEERLHRPGGLLAVMRREIGRIREQRRYILMMVVMPAASFVLIWGLFSNQVPRDLPVAVYDGDHSTLSRTLIRLIDGTPTMAVEAVVADPAEGRDMILRGKAYALIVLPRNMERDAKRGLGAKVLGYYNAQLLLAGSVIYGDLSATVSTASAALDLDARRRRGESGPAAMAHLEPIRLDRHKLFNPHLNYVYFLVCALWPTFLQIFIMFTVVLALGTELKYGTARQWLDTAGGSAWRAVTGKMLVYFIYFSLLGVLMLWVMFELLGLPLRGSGPALAAAVALMVLAYQGVAVVTVAIIPSLRMALSSTAFYSVAAFAFVGITYPQAGMPALAKAWNALLPLTHFLQILISQTLRGAEIAAAIPHLSALLGFAATGLLFLPLLRLKMIREQYWGLP